MRYIVAFLKLPFTLLVWAIIKISELMVYIIRVKYCSKCRDVVVSEQHMYHDTIWYQCPHCGDTL